MGKINKKIIILMELVRDINILNLALILAMILSFFKVNKYITFILVMFIGVILTSITQKILAKYLGDNKSISQSKFFIFFTIIINMVFLIYCFLIKEYGMLILLILFLAGFSLFNRMEKRKSKN